MCGTTLLNSKTVFPVRRFLITRLVASVVDARGEPHSSPTLYHTVRGQPRIQSALARSAVTVQLPHRVMVRLGLYAAHRTNTITG